MGAARAWKHRFFALFLLLLMDTQKKPIIFSVTLHFLRISVVYLELVYPYNPFT